MLAGMSIERMDHIGVVVDDLAADQLVGEVAQHQEMYRLCYLRGPEGIIGPLAEQLG